MRLLGKATLSDISDEIVVTPHKLFSVLHDSAKNRSRYSSNLWGDKLNGISMPCAMTFSRAKTCSSALVWTQPMLVCFSIFQRRQTKTTQPMNTIFSLNIECSIDYHVTIWVWHFEYVNVPKIQLTPSVVEIRNHLVANRYFDFQFFPKPRYYRRLHF